MPWGGALPPAWFPHQMGGRRLSKMEGLGRLRFTIDTCRQPSRLKPPGTNARPRSRGDPRGLPRRTRGGGPLNERGRPPRGGGDGGRQLSIGLPRGKKPPSESSCSKGGGSAATRGFRRPRPATRGPSAAPGRRRRAGPARSPPWGPAGQQRRGRAGAPAAHRAAAGG